MTIAKIIIFLLTTIFLIAIAKNKRAGKEYVRYIIFAIYSTVIFALLCVTYYTYFSIGNIILLIGCITILCNWEEKDIVWNYGFPLLIFALFAYEVALFI